MLDAARDSGGVFRSQLSWLRPLGRGSLGLNMPFGHIQWLAYRSTRRLGLARTALARIPLADFVRPAAARFDHSIGPRQRGDRVAVLAGRALRLPALLVSGRKLLGKLARFVKVC